MICITVSTRNKETNFTEETYTQSAVSVAVGVYFKSFFTIVTELSNRNLEISMAPTKAKSWGTSLLTGA